VEPRQPGFVRCKSVLDESVASDVPVPSPNPMAAAPSLPGSFAPIPLASAPVPNPVGAPPMTCYEPNLPGRFAPRPYAPAAARIPNPMGAAHMTYYKPNLPGSLFASAPKFQNLFRPPPSARVPTTQTVESSMPRGAYALPVAAQPAPMWPMTVPPISVAAPHHQRRNNGWPMTVPPVPVPVPVPAHDGQQHWPMTVPPVPVPVPASDDQQRSNTNIN
jgi:hypothetical protein